ncbi:unnamed protein product [Hyaloperonospora brassicae]|uniref:K-box domain-containing protein n=1 Tax=Hyaloperonospora brassicae TaxID=162125 RepID=A0AAV0USR0_HYABA|nr:unnamed protein product [Hyaloperonospora brassicae]
MASVFPHFFARMACCDSKCVHNVQQTVVAENATLSTTDDSSSRARTTFLSFLASPFALRSPAPVTTKVSHVIATWDDHPLAAHRRTLTAQHHQHPPPQCDDDVEVEVAGDGATCDTREDRDALRAVSDVTRASFAYEVQIWVHSSWPLEGLWHEANQLVATQDPLLVVRNVPVHEHELQFRVRLRATERELQWPEQLSAFFFPSFIVSFVAFLWRDVAVDAFASEVVGEWSDVVTLAATLDHDAADASGGLEALVAMGVSSAVVAVLATLCIGSSCCVLAQLYLRRRRAVFGTRHRCKRQSARWTSSSSSSFESDGSAVPETTGDDTPLREDVDASRENDCCSKSMQHLEHELRDLRQELADSEHEVRRLMLLSGYGLETLTLDELKQLEHALQHTLKRIHERTTQHVTMREAEPVDD